MCVRRHILAAQRVMLLAVLWACRTISTAAMQVITGFLPLDLEIIRAGIMRNISKNILMEFNKGIIVSRGQKS